MSFSILLDYREHSLINFFKASSISHEVLNLCIGDILFKRDDDILLIIERKTVNDLKQSLTDSRYQEQKNRLIESNCNIMYIIEGVIFEDDRSLINSILLSLQLKNNFFIMLSQDTKDTFNILQSIFKKYQDIYSINQSVSNSISYSSFTSLKKKSMYNQWLIQLTTINTISSNIASEIIKEYKSCKDLMLKYHELNFDKEQCIQLLENIVINSKKLGKKKSENIFIALTQ